MTIGVPLVSLAILGYLCTVYARLSRRTAFGLRPLIGTNDPVRVPSGIASRANNLRFARQKRLFRPAARSVFDSNISKIA